MMRIERMRLLPRPGSIPRAFHSSRRLLLTRDGGVNSDTSTAPPRNVVIYDGVCNLCNGGVRFVARRSRRGSPPLLKFCAAQSARGAEVLKASGLRYDDVMNRFAYVDRAGVIHRASSAALEVAREMDWPWPLASVFLVLPTFVRDYVYDVVARHRYRLFGRTDECQLPSEEFRDRFLE